MPTVHYFLGTQVAGSSRVPTHPHSGLLPDSVAFFCRTCGELWARALVEENPEVWQIEQVPCQLHTPSGVPDWSHVPGSITQYRTSRTQESVMFWAVCFDALPRNLQLRDFDMHLRNRERLSHE